MNSYLVAIILLFSFFFSFNSREEELYLITMLHGELKGSHFGVSVASAGDVNGDGYDDIIVGAPHWLNADSLAVGRAYIYLGSPHMDNIPDIVLTGKAYPAIARVGFFGASVAGAGDLNGDGYDDVVISAPYAPVHGYSAGIVYIYFGGNKMDTIPDVTLIEPVLEYEYNGFGRSIASAGDINGDGYDDVIVGRPTCPWYVVGRAYVFFGGTEMDSIADVIIEGGASFDDFGFSVSKAGDVNGDGYGDVIIGSPYRWAEEPASGAAWILFGGSHIDSIPDVILTAGDHSYVYDYFGMSVSDIGNLNGDSYDDLIVSAPGARDSMGIHIFLGDSCMDGIPDFILHGQTSSGVGDINNDGYSDIAIADYGADVISVYFGSDIFDTIPDAGLKMQLAYLFPPVQISEAGDVNNDGYCDLIVGCYSEDKAYIYTVNKQGVESNTSRKESSLTPSITSLCPNPFSRTTFIEYVMRESGLASLKVYDVAGRLVRTLVDEVMDAGSYEVTWNGRSNHQKEVKNGVYFVYYKMKQYVDVKKVVLIR